MKNMRMIVTLFVLGLGSQALAARYMVVFKDKDVFAQTHMQLMLSQAPLSSIRIQKNGQVQKPFAAANVEVQDSFQALKTLVVEADDTKSLEALSKSGAVALVEKEVFHPAPKPVRGFVVTKAWDFNLNHVAAKISGTTSTGPKTPWGIKTVKAPEAWSGGKYGEGARVLVLDTGVDKNHPALKDNFEKGRDFVAEDTTSEDVTDQVGHGTHVAGTIAASFGADGFVGVAPKAKFLMGRVCSAEGCSNIGVTAGINWGIEEKVDVISMSLGGIFATAGEKLAVEAAEAAGVTVVAASGNDSRMYVSYPAAFPTAIAVGASNDKNDKAEFSNWGPELDIVAPGVSVMSAVPVGSGREAQVTTGLPGAEKLVTSTSFVGAPDVAEPLTKELVLAGLGKPEDYQGLNVSGKFALVQRGEITFGDKVKNAIVAGAAGIVIYNNAPGLIQGALTQDGTTVAIPVVMIEQTVGEELKTGLQAGQAVKATLQTVATDYSSFDGTSMACPHVSGVVALMKAANKALTPAQIREAIRATAATMNGPNDTNQYGAGLVNAQTAVETALRR